MSDEFRFIIAAWAVTSVGALLLMISAVAPDRWVKAFGNAPIDSGYRAIWGVLLFVPKKLGPWMVRLVIAIFGAVLLGLGVLALSYT